MAMVVRATIAAHEGADLAAAGGDSRSDYTRRTRVTASPESSLVPPSRSSRVFDPIAQLDEPPRSWSAFLAKAVKGSHKAAEWLVQADLAVAESLGGRTLVEEADDAEYEAFLSRALPGGPPFEGVQELLRAAHAARVLRTHVVARSEPLHERAHYDQLWTRGDEVSPLLLLHDAAHACFEDWNQRSFRRLINEVGEAQLTYNARDAVAAMIYLRAIQPPGRHRSSSRTRS
ncbi:hypothetical protein ABT324_11210 [Saccharopolyspora sp. NPDC000359]|uniref:hypothetical protein n=1 Tax=Saccharopolyspora sp. NPDC000359 TaxID=3154251 RepID=UPI00332D4805